MRSSRHQGPQYTKAQLRELVVSYYALVDPHGLNSGVDINGIVEWCAFYGVDDMNARLKAKYGIGFDYSILNNKEADPASSAMLRISMMPNNRAMQDQLKKSQEIADKLKKFYDKYDPSRIPTIQTFVDWINVNGVDQFNQKLMDKYGDDLDFSKSTPAAAPAPAAAKPPPPEVLEKPPLQKQGSQSTGIILHQKLERFYKKHEPEKVAHIKPIVDWALLAGEDELNSKLVQIYGEGLDDVDDEPAPVPAPPPQLLISAKTTQPAPAAAAKPPPPSAPKVAEAPASAVKPPPPAQPKVAPAATATAKPPPPSAPKAQAAAPAPEARKRTPSEGPCANYKLDMKGSTFGVCECGFSKASHTAGGRPKSTKKPLAPVSATAAAAATPATKPPPPSAPKVAEQPKAEVSTAPATSVKADQPCSNYQLDMKAATFGACKCGWPKADHGKAHSADSGAKAELRKPSVVGGTTAAVTLSPKQNDRKQSITSATSFSSKGKSSPKTESRKQSITGSFSPKTGKKSPAQAEKKSPAVAAPAPPPPPPSIPTIQEESSSSASVVSSSASFDDAAAPPPLTYFDAPPPPFEGYDDIPPPPPLDDIPPPPPFDDIPPPPIEETSTAQVVSNALDMMTKSYIEETGEDAPMSLQQEWAGELIRNGAAAQHEASKLNEIAKSTARMSIDSRLKARARGIPGKHNKKFE